MERPRKTADRLHATRPGDLHFHICTPSTYDRMTRSGSSNYGLSIRVIVKLKLKLMNSIHQAYLPSYSHTTLLTKLELEQPTLRK